MRRRVVVTGLGTVNPLGNSLEESWKGICEGKPGIGTITKFDASAYKTKIAGELKGFDPLDFIEAKERRRLDDFIIYALAGGRMALDDAALTIDSGNADRVGVILGSGIGGIATIEKETSVLSSAGPRRISPFTIPAALPNLAAGNLAIRCGAKGPISCTVTACSAGNNAISDAFRAIVHGYADVMITGGVEAAISPLAIAGFNAMRAISTRNDEPERSSRPFDRDRDGFVLGEGCGILILEEMTTALDRGARIYAEVAGTGMTCDAYHIAAPPEGHPGAAKCMERALDDAGMEPADIDYINAHGTSTPLNDLYETAAIKRVFGPHSSSLPVSSTKSMTGHLLGAAGGIEAIFSVMTIRDGIIPPTINLDNPGEGCDLDYVPHHARRGDVGAVLSNSFGFGGVNTSVIVKKFEE